MKAYEMMIGMKSKTNLLRTALRKKPDPNKLDAKSFKTVDEKLVLNNRLKQKGVAKECSERVWCKVEIKPVR